MRQDIVALCRTSLLVCLKSNQDTVQTVNVSLVHLICASLVEIRLKVYVRMQPIPSLTPRSTGSAPKTI